MILREKRRVLIYVASAGLVAGFMLFRYLPLRRQMKEIGLARSARSVAAAQTLAESGQLSALQKKLRELEKKAGDFEARVPAERGLGTFLQLIANLMNRHNLREQLIQPSEEVQAQNVNWIPVSMQCKGSLSQIFEFFVSLRELDRFMRIERVKLANDGDFSGEVKLQADTVIYHQPAKTKG